MVTLHRTHTAVAADIATSPEGPTVGAFFDFDGTLAAGFTGALLPWDRLRHREMGVGEFLDTVWVALNYSLGRVAFEEFIRRGSMAFKGRRIDELADIGQRIYTDDIEGRLYPEMRALVRAHLDRGHTVVLSSAAFHLQLDPVAQALGIEEVLCNWFEVDVRGVLTGEVRLPILRGATKATAVAAFADQRGVDLDTSYFYADGDEDIPLMCAVGNPRPTNPATALAALAGERGWPVLRFSSRSGNVPVAGLRTGVAALALLPVARIVPCWARLMLAATGVQLSIAGAQNLSEVASGQPVVVLVNHRSGADSIIVAAALSSGRVAAPRPRMGPPLTAGDVDVETRARSELVGGRSVVATVGDALANGDSVAGLAQSMVRVAIDLGVPVVPVVIRNAETVATPRSCALHPRHRGGCGITANPGAELDIRRFACGCSPYQ